MPDTLTDSVCEWCGVGLTIWHDTHDPLCPHELLGFMRKHICHGSDADYQICFPCAEYMEDKMKHSSHFDYALADRWNSPKFHTEFCREMRIFLDKKTGAEEILPKIQKQPKLES